MTHEDATQEQHRRLPLSARVGLVAAIFASTLTFMLVSVFDPLGFRERQAEQVSRETVAVVLCSITVRNERLVNEARRVGASSDTIRRAVENINATHLLSESLLGFECLDDGSIRQIDQP